MLLIITVETTSMRAAPASNELAFADLTTQTLTATDTSIGTELVVWAALERQLPLRVLDRHAGHLLVPAAPATEQTSPGAAAPAWDPRREYQAMIEDTMTVFAAARWALTGNGTLPDVLRELSLGAPDLGAILNIAPPRALALIRGQAALSEAEAQFLADRTARTVAELIEANPPLPESLIARLDRPAARARVTQLAERRGISELVAWRETGYGVYALAARQTGPAQADAWDERIDRYFSVVLRD